jgi:nicotinamide riboside kinase
MVLGAVVSLSPSLVVNLFGGPSTGKSDCARILCSLLNRHKITSEYASEYAKKLTWKEDYVTRSNQVLVTATQFDEILTLYGKVRVVVTDSPVITGVAFPGPCCTPTWEAHVKELHDHFNSLNIFLERNPAFYQAEGRTQTLEECLESDRKLMDFLNRWRIDYIKVPVDSDTVERVLALAMERIKNA